MNTSICLCMIVKNESHVIESTLQNICAHIDLHYWVISDTGSTDDTKEIIEKYFAMKNIPGEIFNDEWVDFGHNRTIALSHARNKGGYIFIFDADDKINGELKLPELTHDMYHLKFASSDQLFTYQRPLLVSNRIEWKFVGVLHEYLTSVGDVSFSVDTIHGEYFVDSGKTGSRSKNPNKYHDDAVVLSKAYETEGDERLRDRYAFYCGQSFKDANDNDNSILWYMKTLQGTNWSQEKYYASLWIGNLFHTQGNNEKAIEYWSKTVEFDKERPEGIVQLMQYFYEKGNHLMVNALYLSSRKFVVYRDDDKLFFDVSTYHKSEYFNSISAFYVQDFDSGYECVKHLLKHNVFIDISIHNLQFYMEKLKSDPDSCAFMFDVVNRHVQSQKNISTYQVDIWNTLLQKQTYLRNDSQIEKYPSKKIKLNQSPMRVMITFTTCKRLDLFKTTVRSILNTWEDFHEIDYWFCVDDNSSVKDAKQMKKLFPWMEFYFKNESEKGHRFSMNLIWEKLNKHKPTYWIHMEDDFLFFKKQSYVLMPIQYLDQMKSQNVNQLLYNRCYAETIDDLDIQGYRPCENCSNCCIHEHIPHHNVGCNYWPHYSFRPSITVVESILSLGNYDSPNQFFEHDYASKYTNAGYQSAYLNEITNIHIGRLTKDRFGNEPNAYTLNNTKQF